MRRVSNVRGALRSLLLGAFLTAGLAGAAPPAPSVERELGELEADKARGPFVRDAVARAKNALTRARDMEKANDAAHGTALRAVAAEWTAFARDLLRAVAVEAKAVLAERTEDELETKLARSRALLEETVARRGRAREALDQLEAPTAPAAPQPDNKGAAVPQPPAPQPSVAPGPPPGKGAGAPAP